MRLRFVFCISVVLFGKQHCSLWKDVSGQQAIVVLQDMDTIYRGVTQEALVFLYAQSLSNAGICSSLEDALISARQEIAVASGMTECYKHIVSEPDGACLGYIVYTVCEADEFSNQPYAYIEGLFIKPSYRGNGCATRALRALEQEVGKHNIHAIQLYVFADNINARLLYEKTGYIVIQSYEFNGVVIGQRMGKIM